jgi:hypothetical protein
MQGIDCYVIYSAAEFDTSSFWPIDDYTIKRAVLVAKYFRFIEYRQRPF